jgi:putative transposase
VVYQTHKSMQEQFTELTESQWEIIKKYLPVQRKRRHCLRNVTNAILWLVRVGGQWRNMESKYPKWQTVYYYFRRWKKLGIIELIHDELVKIERKRQQKEESASLGSIDTQTVKIVPFISEEKGIDGNKKINGRKRHLIVDTCGLIIAILVHSARISDTEGAIKIFEKLKDKFPRLTKILADEGYKSSAIEWVKTKFNWVLEIVQKIEIPKGFLPQKNRWQVERTFSWLCFFRRLSKDYEKTTESSEAMIYLALISIMLNRQTK